MRHFVQVGNFSSFSFDALKVCLASEGTGTQIYFKMHISTPSKNIVYRWGTWKLVSCNIIQPFTNILETTKQNNWVQCITFRAHVDVRIQDDRIKFALQPAKNLFTSASQSSQWAVIKANAIRIWVLTPIFPIVSDATLRYITDNPPV